MHDIQYTTTMVDCMLSKMLRAATGATCVRILAHIDASHWDGSPSDTYHQDRGACSAPYQLWARSCQSWAFTCDFSDCDASLGGCFKVHMVAANAGRQRQLQLLRLGDTLRGEVARKEWCCDDLRFAGAAQTTAGAIQRAKTLLQLSTASKLTDLQGVIHSHTHQLRLHPMGRCNTAAAGGSGAIATMKRNVKLQMPTQHDKEVVVMSETQCLKHKA